MYAHANNAFAGWLCTITVFAVGSGCGQPPEDGTIGSVAQSIIEDNGTSINGTSINGTSINGISVNGTSINGTSINGTSINGTSINGTSMSNNDFVGAIFTGLTGSGASVSLRLDAMDRKPSPDDDVFEWTVSYLANSTWRPLCGLDPQGAPIRAIPLAGVWDPRTGAKTNDGSAFTLACQGSSVAKCVGLGYKPWRTVSGQGLDAYHQACVRMLRADYCGDGTSWTIDGRWIDVTDRLGIQPFATGWSFEAQWSASGAVCVEETRVDWGRRGPACLRSLQRSCDEEPRRGALLMDRFQEQFVIE